jgi:predicted dehydrogenase
MAQLQVAVIGVGPRGLTHLDALRGFDDVTLAAVCDPSDAARDAAAGEYGAVARYAGVDDMLDAETLDAAFVAAPAHLNAEAALPCLRRGVSTLLEKPPGMSAAETVQLRDAAAESGAIGMVGWNRRFHPMIVAAREMVESRGPITQIVGEFHKSMSRLEAGGERHAKVVMDNMLYETPIHSIDLVRALAGSDVTQVHSVVRRAFSQYKDIHAALIEFQNGCVAQITSNYTTDARLERYEIHGRDVSAYLEGVRQGHVMGDGGRVEIERTGGNGTVEQARHFLDAVKAGKPVGPPAADLGEAVKTMELAGAIMAGLRD